MVALWNRGLPYGIGFLSFIFLFFPHLIFFFLTWSQWPQIGCLPYLDTWCGDCGPGANSECRSEMCCEWLAGNAGPKKSLSMHNRTILSGYMFATKAGIDNWKKNLLSRNISSRCSHNMVNFGPLTAEIGPVVWGTPANFNGFSVLAALLHGTLVVGVRQTLQRWTEGATYIRQGGHDVWHWPTF